MRQLKARATQRRSERGVVAIITALSLTMLLMSVAMVLDLGAVRIDRQVNKMAADAATTAGLRGLDKGDGYPYSFRGVCQAITYLQLNRPALGTMTYSPCSNTTKLSTRCDKANPSTWADFTTTVGRYTVQVKSPYSLAASGFAEDSLATMAGDTGDADQGGCDQLAVVVTQTHKPAFGRITSPTDLSTASAASVGSSSARTGRGQRSLLLLERNDCGVLQASSTGVFIHVLGNGTVPGLIHSDSLGNGAGCSSNNIIHSQPDYGIVAYESEVSPKQPGIISTVAKSTATGAVPSKAQDAFPKVVAKPDPGGTHRPGPDHPLGRRRQVLRGRQGRPRHRERNAEQHDRPVRLHRRDVHAQRHRPRGRQGVDRLRQLLAVRCSGALPQRHRRDRPGTRQRRHDQPAQGPARVRRGQQLALRHQRRPVRHAPRGRRDLRGHEQPVPRGPRRPPGQADDERVGRLGPAVPHVVVMLGASSAATTTGCIPSTAGQAYTVTACNGIIDITGGTLRWTAPDAVDSAERTAADYAELEDLALWTEASGSGSKLSANLYLAGVFMLPEREAVQHQRLRCPEPEELTVHLGHPRRDGQRDPGPAARPARRGLRADRGRLHAGPLRRLGPSRTAAA